MKTVNEYLLARKAAFHADASEQFELAEQLKKSADDVRSEDECCEEAAMFYWAAAEKGHAQAQYELGHMYQFGLGVEKNFFVSARWYRRAAKQGHGEAIRRLAHLYRTGKGVRKSGFTAMFWVRMYDALLADRRKGRAAGCTAELPTPDSSEEDPARAAQMDGPTPAVRNGRRNGGPNNA